MGTFFSYVFNNYWDTNYRAAQGGDLVFSYSVRLSDGRFDPLAATRFGWESMAAMADPGSTQTLLQTGTVEAMVTASPDLPATPALRLAGDDVIVGRVTRRGDGLLVRLYNPRSTPAKAAISLPGRSAATVRPADLVGYPIPSPGSAAKTITVPARGLSTVLISVKSPRRTAKVAGG